MRNTNWLPQLLKYFICYSVFLVILLLTHTPNSYLVKLGIWRDLHLIFLFFIFCCPQKELISTNNLFFLGLLLDTVDFLPFGLSGLVLTNSLGFFRLLIHLQQYSAIDSSIYGFTLKVSIFFCLYFSIQWLFYSIYKNNFYNFSYILGSIGGSICGSLLLYPIYNHHRNV
jgi:hypothetical protein